MGPFKWLLIFLTTAFLCFLCFFLFLLAITFIVMNEKTNATVGISCDVCFKKYDDAKSLRNHRKEYHPSVITVKVLDKEGNLSPFKLKPIDGLFDCPICDRKGIQTRSGVICHTKTHVNEHEDDDDLRISCLICKEKFETSMGLDAHYDTHDTTQELLDESLTMGSMDAETLRQSKIEFNLTTKNTLTSDYLIDITVPHIVEHANGEKSLFLLSDAATKRLASHGIVNIRPAKKPKTNGITDPQNLSVLLSSNRYGNLVDLEKYDILDPSFFLLEFKTSMDIIARKLAGAVIQTGSRAILILKAEVYGRSSTEDPHFINQVQPTTDVKKISVIRHDKTDKLIIGTLKWNALVTSCIDLTTGEIEVGAHNRSTQTATTFTVWGNKEWRINPMTERQLRSKFHREETFMNRASIYFPFAHWTCLPITIFNLYNYYDNSKSESGEKSVSLLFYEIFTSESKRVKKKLLKKILSSSKEGTQAQKTLTKLLDEVPPDKKKLSLIENYNASNLLRILADGLCSSIASKNKKNVTHAIRARINKILQDKA